ncbi:MAG: PAS domain-containing protein [Allomuricauda sp.]
MEKIRFYDEAVNLFYREREIKGHPITSLDFYAPHFGKFCNSLHDVKKLGKLAKKENWQDDHGFQREILDNDHVVVVTDTALNIVYASQNIYTMNGYRPGEIIGKKPKMFQGEGTCRETTKKVSVAIEKQIPFEVVLTNYRKNGTAYKCWIKGFPVLDGTGKLVNFIAFEKEVA